MCLAANHCTIDVPPALSPQLPPFVRLLLPLLPPPPPPVAATDAATDADAEKAATRPSPLHVSAALCLVQLMGEAACVQALVEQDALPALLAHLEAPPS